MLQGQHEATVIYRVGTNVTDLSPNRVISEAFRIFKASNLVNSAQMFPKMQQVIISKTLITVVFNSLVKLSEIITF